MSEIVIKTIVGDAAYKTEQEFSSVEDAYEDKNPLTVIKTTITDLRISSKRYKLKPPEKLHAANTTAFGNYAEKTKNDIGSNTSTDNTNNG